MKIGFCNGCFDVFHRGHSHFLKEAVRQCSYLVVAVNTDEWVRAAKGPARPFHHLQARMEDVSVFLSHCVGATRYGHAVIPFDGDPDPLILSIRPEVVFRGEDQFGVGRHITVPVVRIARIPGYSTTSMAQRRDK